MFYDIFEELCRNNKIAPSALTRKLGMSSSAPGRWKNGSTPDLATSAKIADYFGVSIDYLCGREELPDTKSYVVSDMSEEELELLRIFREMDIKSKIKTLTYFYDLEEGKGL